MIYISIFIVFFIIFSCSRKDTPLSPEISETFTPTSAPASGTPTIGPTFTCTPGIINGTLNLPSSAQGKNYYIYLFDTFTGFANADAGISGICGTENSVPYSIAVPPGNYYMAVFVDMDGDGFPGAGDYVGVYGATWPEWPVSANITISEGEVLNYDLDLVTGFNNVTGTINLYEAAPNEICQIFIDIDTTQTNSNYVARKNVFVMEGVLSAGYSLLVLVPGNYYVYAGIDLDESGLPFTTPDQFGYWGVCGCNPKNPPGYANAIISDLSASYNFSFTLGKY